MKMDQQKRTESPEIDPLGYGQLIFDKDTDNSVEKGIFSTKSVEIIGYLS